MIKRQYKCVNFEILSNRGRFELCIMLSKNLSKAQPFRNFLFFVACVRHTVVSFSFQRELVGIINFI
jgi:hypothetical protein